MPFTCPYCGQTQVTSRTNSTTLRAKLDVGTTDEGELYYEMVGIRCLNDECKKLSLRLGIGQPLENAAGYISRISPTRSWQLLPDNSAKALPDFIPEALRNDYYESCKIVSLSPKASATLSRRCLQGMIRDFCGISERTLKREIDKLSALSASGDLPKGVSEDAIEAIDSIRSVGNIGAHMESDINVIVDIDPDEAKLLIALIEQLFEEWYVARYNREQRLEKVKELAKQKEAERSLGDK